MIVQEDLSFDRLYAIAWYQAKDTLRVVHNNDLEDDLMLLLEDVFGDRIPTLNEVNDLLSFDSEYIYEQLGISYDNID